jgi:hypothetical protein
MDVDFTQMTQMEREELMKSRSCFNCKKQGHLSKNCPKKCAHIQEATIEGPPKQSGNRRTKKKDEPPSYDSLVKQINTCSMKDRQKLMEAFSNAGSEGEEDF